MLNLLTEFSMLAEVICQGLSKDVSAVLLMGQRKVDLRFLPVTLFSAPTP
jgi:hypothetical protein